MINMILFVLLMLLPNLVQAQQTRISEDFEGTAAEIQARWPGQSYCCFPNSGGPFNLVNSPVTNGSQALRYNFVGSYDETGGFQCCQPGGAAQWDYHFGDKEIWITWYSYMAPGFKTAGGLNATPPDPNGIGGIATKGLYQYMYSPSTGAVRGWVFHYFYGGRLLTLSAQGIKDAPEGPYGTHNMFPNVNGYSQPDGQWVGYEAHFKLNTPGQADGVYELYVTPQGGTAFLSARYANREFVDATTSGMMPSDTYWFRQKLFRQDGLGYMYIDALRVTTGRIGLGTTPPPPPPPPSDTLPPTTPGTPNCTPGETSASCTWSASSDESSPITYSLQFRVGSNNFVTGATSNTNNATLNGLSLSTSYDARVIATDPGGRASVASSIGTFTTSSGSGGGGGGGGGTGTVLVDAVSASASDAVLRSSRSWSHTIANQPNRILLVCLTAQDASSEATAAGSSVTFNGTALTFVRKDAQLAGGRYIRSELWGLAGPPVGPGTIIATWAGSPNAYAVGRAISAYGALAGAPINANNGNTGFGTIASAVVTTSVDNALVVDCTMARHQSGISVGSGQILQSSTIVPPIADIGGSVGMSVAVKVTAGAETMDWATPSNYWAISSLAVAPEPTAPAVPPTITNMEADATGANFTFGPTTPTQVRIVIGNNIDGTMSSQLYPIADFPAGRFTITWPAGATYACGYPVDADGVQNPSATAHRCDSLVGLVAVMDTVAPVISNCKPGSTLPVGTTEKTWTCDINKAAVGKWGTSDVPYVDLPNTATTAALTISGTVVGLTNGSSTSVYVGASTPGATTASNTLITIAVAAAPLADTTRPSTVAGLTATNLGQVAELNWDVATDNIAVTSYQVYQSTGDCSVYIPAGNPVTNTKTVLNLAAATIHCWKVKALDGSNNDSLDFSNVATITTSGTIDVESPSRMLNLRITNRYSESVLLQWDIGIDNSGPPKSLIEQCTVIPPALTCEIFEIKKTEILDRSLLVRLVPNTTYCWKGKNSDSSGNVSEIYSDVVCGATNPIASTDSVPRLNLAVPRIDAVVERLPAPTRLNRP